jgi:hypothetical protein
MECWHMDEFLPHYQSKQNDDFKGRGGSLAIFFLRIGDLN